MTIIVIFFRIRYKSIKSLIVFHVVTRHYVSHTKKNTRKLTKSTKAHYFVLNISPIIWKESKYFRSALTSTLQQDDLFKRDNSFGAAGGGGHFLIKG